MNYTGRAGHAMIDRELYLPRSWISDSQRCAAAGVPDEVEFATQPVLARMMIIRALDVGVPAKWATGDEVYGAEPALRAHLQPTRWGCAGHRLDRRVAPRPA